MFDFLEKLRSKPEKVKKQIAFFVSIFLAGIIFVVWLSVIYPDFRQSQKQKQKVENLTPSPFSTFTTQLSSGISSISEKFSEIKNTISSFSTSPAYYSATTSIVVGTTTNQ
ncbi:MAG: hypothetical protein HY507_00870 [Candidatus Zambryskibacteria bacterium]|nr:hypothetical protein [Candidatus Zambryskibacteria bacterium]